MSESCNYLHFRDRSLPGKNIVFSYIMCDKVNAIIIGLESHILVNQN